jgi:YHS domain-containing protein
LAPQRSVELYAARSREETRTARRRPPRDLAIGGPHALDVWSPCGRIPLVGNGEAAGGDIGQYLKETRMKKGWTLALGLAFAVGGFSFLVAEEQEHGAKCGTAKSECPVKCPISGGKVSKEASVDYKGGKVYFCCPGCIPKFKEDQAKYEAKANEQLVLSGQFEQIGCPLTGGRVNPSTKIKVCGIDVGFCCKGCQGKVKTAAADKQSEIVFVKGFDKAFAFKKPKESKEKEEK